MITTLSRQAMQLIGFGLLVLLLAGLALVATLRTSQQPDSVTYVNGSFSSVERADYAGNINQRVAPQRAIVRG